MGKTLCHTMLGETDIKVISKEKNITIITTTLTLKIEFSPIKFEISVVATKKPNK